MTDIVCSSLWSKQSFLFCFRWSTPFWLRLWTSFSGSAYLRKNIIPRKRYNFIIVTQYAGHQVSFEDLEGLANAVKDHLLSSPLQELPASRPGKRKKKESPPILEGEDEVHFANYSHLIKNLFLSSEKLCCHLSWKVCLHEHRSRH